MSPENIKVDVRNNRSAASAAADLLWQTLVSDELIQLPIDINRIAELLSIGVYQGKLRSDVSGVLIKDKRQDFQALINSIYPNTH